MEPIRVLQVVPAMDMGGLEMFIMNVYRKIDREKIQFDFLYHYARPCFFDEEILSLGGRIFRTSIRQDNHFPRYFKELDQFFQQHTYPILHGHYSGFAVFYNHFAKKHGVPVRISHSHNTQTEKSLTGFLDAVLSWFCKFGVTDRFSCGQQAGRALYGRRSFELYPNGIDVAKFAFDEDKRRATRQRFGLGDEVLYGHIGRFTQQKNHSFLLDCFGEMYRQNPNSRLLLAGEGPLMEAAKAQCQSLGLSSAVIFAGIQADTPALYSAMDGFVLPSLFEGFPVVLVEAQANGVPVFAADTISPEAKLVDNFAFLPLAEGPGAWARQIAASPLQRQDNGPRLLEAGYDIGDTARRLSEFYLSHAPRLPKE